VELWIKSLIIPSIQAVAVLSSMEIGAREATDEDVAIAVAAAKGFRFLSGGGNNGNPENPQTAGG